MSAQVTEAHREIARRITGRTNQLEHFAQLIADSEAQATAELRGALALGQQNCDDVFEDLRLERDQLRAKQNNLRADLDAIKAIRDEETARAERAEAEVERLLHLEALLNQAAAEVTAHTFTAGGIAGLRAENDRLRRAYVRPDDIRAQLESAIARAERAEAELAAEREKVRVLKLDKDRLDWWSGEPYYQFGKSHKCMNPGWWWSCGFESGMHGKYGIKNIRDAIDSAMAYSKSGRNKYNVCKRIEQSSTEDDK